MAGLLCEREDDQSYSGSYLALLETCSAQKSYLQGSIANKLPLEALSTWLSRPPRGGLDNHVDNAPPSG